ncbi:hypothetical protein RclHR1_10920007 [Rhizophagus clarus]|uniref:Protein kinase domain-containing protein n=1 Tax=Rhizophagus clarus TaxID=94130 RepID=A0A2Z6Q7H7_9GLOM|nr:hypothetical protein RclHR1_10920007 [Rhizophagus clarus]
MDHSNGEVPSSIEESKVICYLYTGLNGLHKQNLVHCDFHDGNILNHEDKKNIKDKDKFYISDLGLCQSVKVLKKYDIYVVIPFMAPEVLRGKPYSVIYDYVNDLELLKILHNVMDLMKKCWNEDPLKRPSASEHVIKVAYLILLVEILESECLNCIIGNTKPSDIGTDKI